MGGFEGVGSRVRAGRAIAVLALATCLGALSSAQTGLQAAFAGSPAPLELRRRLGALPVTELPQLFRLAVDGRLALSAADSFLALDDGQRALTRAALAARPRRELVLFLEELVRAPFVLEERLEAHLLLAAVGESEQLRLLLRLSTSPDQGSPELELRASFTDALSAILARQPTALEQIGSLFSECPPAFTAPVVEAVARRAGARATWVLARMLGRAPGLDGLLLARLSQRGRMHGSSADFVFDALQRYLHQSDSALVVAAAQAVAELGDDGAVEELIALLEHRDERVRAGAFRALARLSGLDFGEDVARWTGWYHAEMRWWEHEADAQLARIERAHAQEYTRAAREVLEHRLFRERMAESFAVALARRDPDEVWLACRALRELRSPVAVSSLVECLQRDDERLQSAACDALRAITGADLGPDPESWQAYVN